MVSVKELDGLRNELEIYKGKYQDMENNVQEIKEKNRSR